MPNSKYWIFTDFDTSPARIVFLDTLYPRSINQMVYQMEKCPETDRLHLQGFLGVHKNSSMKAIKELLKSDKVHLERVKKGVAAASNYCMKDESRVEGTHPKVFGDVTSGSRSDLLQCKDLIDKGSTLLNVYETYFEESARYYKFFKEYHMLKTPKRNGPMDIAYIYGPPGSGKTRSVFDKESSLYFKDCTTKWWDTYQNEDAVLLDDFSGEIPYTTMLRIMDRYPMMCEVKNGHIQFNSKRMYITSNISLDDILMSYKEKNPLINTDAFRRRIGNVVQL